MSALTKAHAVERLASAVETVRPTVLPEVFSELFPERRRPSRPLAGEMARHIRQGLEGEEIVDLWNVVFPDDRNVWYDPEDEALHYNEQPAEYAE